MSKTPVNQRFTLEAFIARWSGREGGQERSNYALFLSELCDVIGVERPDPAEASHELNDYVFERRVERRQPDGSKETGRIDLYKRGCFILEAKQSRQKGGKKAIVDEQADLFGEPSGPHPTQIGTLDHLMINARRQAERYASSLPPDHPYPPFILTCDVGRVIEVYADFSGHGRHYSPFPDTLSYRVELSQIARPETRDRLRQIWLEPNALDPARQTARVTREIAGKLAAVSKALENRGFDPRIAAVFLMRCLFTMFVEDVELIKKDSFKELLARCVADPKRFPHEMRDLWQHMDAGDYSPAIGAELLCFNGKLFKNASALPLTADEIKLLQNAARADWRDLEPAIFGSLFEQALDQEERKRLGAHYTPRAYVELLVNATIMEPLTEDWQATQAAVERAIRQGSKAVAIREIQDFLKELSKVRVLDPACGTGNFLYVALMHMKQLEGEVTEQLLRVGGESALAAVKGVSVKPEQFLGLEINQRAVEIAELVLWVGYLQWHLRTRTDPPEEPILGNSDHVLYQDAVLSWRGYPKLPLKTVRGRPVTRQGPEGKPVEVYMYPSPRRPDWPDADFIVGNPPFIGGKDVRSRLGEEYVEALWKVHKDINRSADYVMYWWDRAAEELARKGSRLRRFGLVTTNSISQVFQRRIVERRLKADPPISLLMAIPDHPWTKANPNAASVRIAMTVAALGSHTGVLREIAHEEALDTDEPIIRMIDSKGILNADLSVGADVTSTIPLQANDGLCSPGVKLHGDGFIVTKAKAAQLGLGEREELEQHIREYRNGRDLTARPRGVMAIDLFGLQAEEVRAKFPEVYGHLLEAVKPERDKNKRATYKQNWWIFGEPRRELRPAIKGLNRYIVTVETTRHRVFQFLDASLLPDNMLVAVASDDAFHLGILSSRIHIIWALRAGGWLGVGNDPRYSKSRCFDPFPFSEASEAIKIRIRSVADELDSTRKAVLAEYPDLTLTTLYNVLEKLKVGEALNAKEQDIKTRGRVLILSDLHEQIDAAVFQAYGWENDLSDDEILRRLVSLNEERAAEERRGFIRWLRPEYQIERFGPLAHRADRVQTIAAAKRKPAQVFPQEVKAQVSVVLRLLRRAQKPLTPQEIALSFKHGEKVLVDVEDILKSLTRLGDAVSYDNGRTYISAAA